MADSQSDPSSPSRPMSFHSATVPVPRQQASSDDPSLDSSSLWLVSPMERGGRKSLNRPRPDPEGQQSCCVTHCNAHAWTPELPGKRRPCREEGQHPGRPLAGAPVSSPRPGPSPAQAAGVGVVKTPMLSSHGKERAGEDKCLTR